MAIDERLRLNIHTKFSELLGPDEADAIMSNMLPIQWRDVATKDDLQLLRADFRAETAELRTEIHRSVVGQTRWLTGYVTALSVVMLAVARLLF